MVCRAVLESFVTLGTLAVFATTLRTLHDCTSPQANCSAWRLCSSNCFVAASNRVSMFQTMEARLAIQSHAEPIVSKNEDTVITADCLITTGVFYQVSYARRKLLSLVGRMCRERCAIMMRVYPGTFRTMSAYADMHSYASTTTKEAIPSRMVF